MSKGKRLSEKINEWVCRLDKSQLGWFGLLLIAVLIAPILYLGEGSVFIFHDQLDETILSYVFAGRYPGADVYEQMMNGLPAEGLKPSAVLFVPLYYLFKPRTAFVLQYIIILVTAFYGMYGTVRKLTNSSICAFLSATAFAMLPFRPVYGLSAMGVPFLLFCILKFRDVFREKFSWKKAWLPFLGIVFFAFTSNLVLVGYAILIVMAVVWLFELIVRKVSDKALFTSGIILFFCYAVTNLDLILQLFTEAKYVSHREEYLVMGSNFFSNIKVMFETGVFHTYSYHSLMWIPIIVAVVILIFTCKKEEENKKLLQKIGLIFALIVSCILLYGVLASDCAAALKNQMGGMLKSFQFERFHWMLPAAWHLLFGCVLFAIWKSVKKKNVILAIVVLFVAYMPTLLYVTKDSIFYQNVNQIRKGNASGNMSWENIYAEDVMTDIENHIGMDMSEYRVANLGMCPVVTLMHGFYTIDGYSNNYPLDYKHEFREIIEEDIALSTDIENYYDLWGSRVYLFHSDWGTNYLVSKYHNAQIEELHLDVEKMREMGCEYLFSAAEILDAEEHDLKFEGSFESESSWWRVWLYKL